MDFITHVQTQLAEILPNIISSYPGEIAVGSLSELETTVKRMTQELGNDVIRQTLEAQDGKYPTPQHTCPDCGGQAGYVRRREGMVITLQGRVSYRRAYYVCEQCRSGHYPLDERLGIKPGQMSEEVIQIAALVGIHDAFGTSRDLLTRTTLLELSPQSIRKACQRVGEQVIAHEQRLEADSQDLGRQREHARQMGPPTLCGSMDGFMVLFEDGWHEMKGGAWWTVDEQGKAQAIQYYVDTASADEFTDLVWATGFAHLADQAEALVFVTDAAEWIENIIAQHFPHAIRIVDWYHACEYLTPVAVLAGQTEAQRAAWLDATTTDLWEGRIEQVITACTPFIRPGLKPDDDPAQQAVRFFTNHRQRMDYPTYRDQGYPIGSGTMESACKQLGLERLKIAGARWGQDRESARKVAKARAAYLSGQWDEIRARLAA